MTVSATSGVAGQQAQQATGGHDAFRDMNLDTFIKLLIVELQNQDPLNPMDNAQILQQISQIRAIESNQRLTDTLTSVRLGQDLSTASSMLGRNIMGLTDAGEWVTGEVDWVSLSPTGPKLHLGDHVVALKNVSMLLPIDSEWRDGDGNWEIPPEVEQALAEQLGAIAPPDDEGNEEPDV